MEKLGQTMRDAGNYWIIGVRFPERRGELMVWICDLMDRRLQERKWIYKTRPGGQESFDAEIRFAGEMFFDELGLDNNIKNNTMPYDYIGDILKSKKEAEKLYEAAEIFSHMLDNCYTNKEYLTYPDLNKLRQRSVEAFRVFMENEKDNKEFCKFIVGIIKEEKRNWFDINLERSDSYLIILDYIKKCDDELKN